MPAAIRLQDTVLQFTPGGADDGAFTAGTPITICVDDFRFALRNGRVDTTCGQAGIKWYREGQRDFECSFTAKLGATDMAQGTPDGWLVQAMENALGRISIDMGGGDLVVEGLVEVEINGGEVPTANVSIVPYGVAPTIT